ncbi:MAG: right-handed parallel beta-helix repeat-containing protein [Bacteroidia bacterium]|nr:right-handed parallel beta-helix repeat-containing protein [Bacteroidia bacterium]
MKNFVGLIGVFCILLGLVSCERDPSSSDTKSTDITFSLDTLYFDTVFTTVGSATRRFKIYNASNNPISISEINLGAGSKSYFRLNIDGVAGNTAENIELEGKDSIFVFVEVTIDPNNSSIPLIVVDSVNFIASDGSKSVKLVAWGQDAFFHKGEIVPCDTIWTSEKPHVIINSILVDSLCKLTIEEGTQIFSHSGSRIFVKGSLIVNGTLENPVVFQADRLESFYDDLPGQWDGIHFLIQSTDNVINYAVIKNGVVGVRLDSLSTNNFYKLTMTNTVIHNITSAGILAITSSIDAENCLVYNCGDYCIQLEYGGIYDLKHCTFANYSSVILSHKKSLLRLNNYLTYNDVIYGVANLGAYFTNCIIYGNKKEEIDYDPDPSNTASDSITFTNCIMRTELTTLSTTDCYINNSNGSFIDPFVDPFNSEVNIRDYHIVQGSDAVTGGKYINIDKDLDAVSRATSSPSIGCYEFVE